MKYLSRRGQVISRWDNPDGTYSYHVQFPGEFPTYISTKNGTAGWLDQTTDVPYILISSNPNLLCEFIYLMWE